MRTEICEYCGGEYKGVSGLHRHQSFSHDEEVTVSVGCNWCGSPVDIREWEVGERHYCDNICSNAWNAFLKQGRRHPNYKDGSTRPEWFKWLQMAVRRRDGGCLKCGKRGTRQNGRALHVHHITPEDDTDTPHVATNLISACDECHQPLEKMDEAEQLEACGIESRSELELSAEQKGWVKELRESPHAVQKAPKPRMGMFTEAQKAISEREDD